MCSVRAAALEGPAAERTGGGAGHRATAQSPVLLARVDRGRIRPRGARRRPRVPRLASRPRPLRVRPTPTPPFTHADRDPRCSARAHIGPVPSITVSVSED